jgi:hypothetical protein
MKKFISDLPNHDTTVNPIDDYNKAKKFHYISIGDHYFFYRWLLIMKRYIPIKNIARCYIRIDSCNPTGCCGSMPIDSKYLVLVRDDGKQKTLWLDDRSVLDSIIQELKLKNNNIAVGYVQKTVQNGNRKQVMSQAG